MLQTCVRPVALFFALLVSMGCGRDGVLEAPDGGITVTTLEAIHGRVGHLVEFTIGNSNIVGVTDQVVLQMQDSEVSEAVLYLSLTHTSDGTTSVAELINLLKRAIDVSLVSSLPNGIKQRGGVILSFGDKSDPSFMIYLRIVTPTETLYWSVRGNLGTDRRDWFLTEVRKPPKVIDTGPGQIIKVNYYADEDLTQLLVDEVELGSTVYAKVVFSKDVRITFADNDRAQPYVGLTTPSSPWLFQYRMKPRGSILASGDAQPYQGSRRIFIAKYEVLPDDIGGSLQLFTRIPPPLQNG